MKTEEARAALNTMLKGMYPDAIVMRNNDKPPRLEPGGYINQRDQDVEPEEVGVTLSPLAYTYDDDITLDIIGYGADIASRQTSALVMANGIAAACLADPYLGGNCDWVRVHPAVAATFSSEGTASHGGCEVHVTLTYTE